MGLRIFSTVFPFKSFQFDAYFVQLKYNSSHKMKMTTGHARGRKKRVSNHQILCKQGWGESRSKTQARLQSTVPNLNLLSSLVLDAHAHRRLLPSPFSLTHLAHHTCSLKAIFRQPNCQIMLSTPVQVYIGQKKTVIQLNPIFLHTHKSPLPTGGS